MYLLRETLLYLSLWFFLQNPLKWKIAYEVQLLSYTVKLKDKNN
jgi:hypothetical protein